MASAVYQLPDGYANLAIIRSLSSPQNQTTFILVQHSCIYIWVICDIKTLSLTKTTSGKKTE